MDQCDGYTTDEDVENVEASSVKVLTLVFFNTISFIFSGC